MPRRSPEDTTNQQDAQDATHTASSSSMLEPETFTTLTAWGANFAGLLGNGTTTDSSTPVQVSEVGGITAIAFSGGHALALKDDGTVWAWGHNQFGELGNGTNANSTAPVQVSDLDGVKAIAAAGSHGLALKNDGTVWAWGFNQYGQLGIGSPLIHIKNAGAGECAQRGQGHRRQ